MEGWDVVWERSDFVLILVLVVSVSTCKSYDVHLLGCLVCLVCAAGFRKGIATDGKGWEDCPALVYGLFLLAFLYLHWEKDFFFGAEVSWLFPV